MKSFRDKKQHASPPASAHILHKLVANDLEAPYVETGTKCYVDFGQKRGQSVTEARSQRHFTMAAALVAAKTKSAPRAPKC